MEFQRYPNGVPGEAPPVPKALLTPGGSTIEDLQRLSPQSVDEIYNEFDFLDWDKSDVESITYSHGESISPNEDLDFAAIVQRAEHGAEKYHSFLKKQKEVRSDRLSILERQSFLASPSFATVVLLFAP